MLLFPALWSLGVRLKRCFAISPGPELLHPVRRHLWSLDSVFPFDFPVGGRMLGTSLGSIFEIMRHVNSSINSRMNG